MSDDSVGRALRSAERLVLIEAPAGCGKTHQAADYVRSLAIGQHRPLVLTHTHAACSVFADRTSGSTARPEIRTIDSLVAEIAKAYHAGLDLPPDVSTWARQRKGGHAEVAARVANLVTRYPMIAASVGNRYSAIVCDEHQDSNGDQHALIMALLGQGALLRIFADPMQKIFKDTPITSGFPAYDWKALCSSAQSVEELDVPHRWSKGCPHLGRWTLEARKSLRAGGAIDLRRNRPPSVEIVIAENRAQKNLDYRIDSKDRSAIDIFERVQNSLLVLTRHNDTARALRSHFNRRISLWEGYTRPALESFVDEVQACNSDKVALASAVIKFLQTVAVGLSDSAFGHVFEEEVRGGCVSKRRGRMAKIQELARLLVDEPNHRGACKVLAQLAEFRRGDPTFRDVKIDCFSELNDAIRLAEFDGLYDGLSEITRRRSYSRPKPPERAISTIHKAKGLECDSVIVVPCDAKTFPDKSDARCLLYVAISRARKRLLLVVSRENPSPLLIL